MKYYLIIILFLFLASCKKSTETQVNIKSGIIIEEDLGIDPNDNIRVIWNKDDQRFLDISKTIAYRGIAVFTIDTCEWIYFNLYGSETSTLIHKPQCPHCKKIKNESIHID